MSSNFTVVYDACVLYPAPLRDLLMRLALTDRFRARWSNTIHDEWIRNLLKQRPELDPAALEKTRALMNSSVRDSLVEGFEHLIPAIELPDPDDRHVVACGRLRRRPVDISGTVFHPLALPQVIEDCFTQLLAKAGAIPEPSKTSAHTRRRQEPSATPGSLN